MFNRVGHQPTRPTKGENGRFWAFFVGRRKIPPEIRKKVF